ncbi:MAG: AAA-like domain-containing protein, partial [Spirulina sp.]
LQDCLRQSEVLSAAMKAVVEESKPVTVGNDEAFKLYSLGLVRREGNAIAPRCRLYRLYFQECL